MFTRHSHSVRPSPVSTNLPFCEIVNNEPNSIIMVSIILHITHVARSVSFSPFLPFPGLFRKCYQTTMHWNFLIKHFICVLLGL